MFFVFCFLFFVFCFLFCFFLGGGGGVCIFEIEALRRRFFYVIKRGEMKGRGEGDLELLFFVFVFLFLFVPSFFLFKKQFEE